jgi:hypothetical protein
MERALPPREPAQHANRVHRGELEVHDALDARRDQLPQAGGGRGVRAAEHGADRQPGPERMDRLADGDRLGVIGGGVDHGHAGRPQLAVEPRDRRRLQPGEAHRDRVRLLAADLREQRPHSRPAGERDDRKALPAPPVQSLSCLREI